MLDAIIQSPWNISSDMAKRYTKKELENTLKTFNRAAGNSFYAADYYSRKLIVGTSAISTLTGYSKDVIERENYNFFLRILSKEEQDWFDKMHAKAYDVFFKYPKSQRLSLEIAYDLVAFDVNHRELILHNRFVPYQLCKNGNLWIGLCFISLASFLQPVKAFMANVATGEKFDYDGNEFKQVGIDILTKEEIKILQYFIKDFSPKQIYDLMGMSKSSFGRKQQILFQKLGVETAGGAVHQAHLRGIV